MIRSFLAIDVRGGQILEQILTFQRMLVNTGADVKVVEAENIHITLRFLGEIQLSLAERIGGELKTLRFDRFKAYLGGVGVFPNIRRINVIWIGIERGLLEFISIYDQVESMLKRLGIRPDIRGFKPHITVARVRTARNKNKLDEVIRSMEKIEFGTFFVDSVKLKKSILTPKGPIYITLMETIAK